MIALMALAAGLALPSPQLDIATRVAGPGKPDCVSQAADGATGPCLPVFRVTPGGQINAWTSGTRIAFSRAAAVRLTRDEFALLAGHEIAHYYLGRRASGHADELEADRLGAQLACAAGFDVAAGASVFRFLQADADHPPPAVRRAAVLAAGCRPSPSARAAPPDTPP